VEKGKWRMEGRSKTTNEKYGVKRRCENKIEFVEYNMIYKQDW
jgi:hypothetical protein